MKKLGFIIFLIVVVILISGCIQNQAGNKIANETINQTEKTIQPLEIIKSPNISPQNNKNISSSSTKLEQDYPEIIAQIEQSKLKINKASQIAATRTTDIQLNDCDGNVCFVSALTLSKNNAHLDCKGKTIKPKGNAKTAFVITANNVSIVNCHIESFEKAIKILGSDNIITKNTIINNPNGGIVIEGNNNNIFNNIIKDNKWAGVEIKAKGKENIIYNNTMIDTKDLYAPYTNSFAAIGISGSDNVVLENIIQNNAEIGVKMMMFSASDGPPQRNLIAKNIIENCSVLAIEIYGAVEKQEGENKIPLTQIKEDNNIIFNNTLLGSKKEFGLRIRWSNSNKIIENNISNNNWQGMHLLTSNNNLIEKNIIFKNGNGGIWLGNSDNNKVYSNQIYENKQHCGIQFTTGDGKLSTNNIVKDNILTANEGMHSDGQICDEDSNLIFQNEFK